MVKARARDCRNKDMIAKAYIGLQLGKRNA
jgi:hypothetical protein